MARTYISSITLPASLRSIAGGAFSFCENLKSIEVSEDSEYFVSTDGVLFDKTREKLLCYPAGREEKEYKVGEGVIEIGDGAFGGSKVERIILPSSLTKIGRESFNSCSHLKEINLPSSLIYLGKEAFRDCLKLEGVQLSSNIQTIEESTFTRCFSLKEIDIPESVKEIKKEAFFQCQKLERVTLPSSLLAIGDRAFFSSKNLKKINIPLSLVSIGKEAFQICPLLSIKLSK